MNKKYRVCLTSDERHILENICRKGAHKSRELKRAQVLLKSDAGLTDEKIAIEVNISTPTVERIHKRFCLEGLTSSLNEKKRLGRPHEFDLRIETEVVALVCSSPPKGHKRWTGELLKREADKKCSKKLSESTLRSILEKHDLKPWKKKRGASPILLLNL
jgi:transposase